jgi:hypothetical protein
MLAEYTSQQESLTTFIDDTKENYGNLVSKLIKLNSQFNQTIGGFYDTILQAHSGWADISLNALKASIASGFVGVGIFNILGKI